MLPPLILHRPRVLLLPLRETHTAALLTAANESRARTTPLPGSRPTDRPWRPTSTRRSATGRPAGRCPSPSKDRTSQRLVGTTRFLGLDYWSWPPAWPPGRATPRPEDNARPAVAEIGNTWLAASAQGTGLNAEMKLLMLGHAFDTWAVHRVSFETDARNLRSRNAIERIGGRFEGVRRAHSRAVDGTIRDSAYYSIIAAEWPAVRERLRLRQERA